MITEVQLITEDVELSESWTTIGSVVDTSPSDNGVAWLELTKNGCNGIEVKVCIFRDVAGVGYEFVPLSIDPDGDKSAVTMKRMEKDTHKFAFQMPSLKGASGVVVQIRCLRHKGDEPVCTGAYVTHE